MFRYLQLCLLVSAATYSYGFFSRDYKWNSLKVTWGINPFSTYTLADMPLKESQARVAGFQKISDCGDSSSLLGRRYVKDNDTALILIYDVQGYIAGISAVVPTSNAYPSRFLANHPFVKKNNQNIISAYFVDPGVHYWFNVRRDMSCDEFYPVFLLYNSGQLDAFGWAFATQLTSPRIEHPPHRSVSAFMDPVLECLNQVPNLSTMHIYLSDEPSLC